MHFSVDQPLDVSREVAESALVDPSFYASLGNTASIGTPEVLSRQQVDGRTQLAVRYRFTGSLARPARAVLDPDKLSWVIESTMYPAEHRAEFRMLPDHYAERIDCSGTYRFEERGTSSAQIIEGDLVVHFPVVAGVVERAILAGIRQNMADQAKLISRWSASP